MPVDLASGRGTMDFMRYGASDTHVVLIVSANAVGTTQLAHYQLDIRLK